jgi:hypothetical protein
MKFLIAILLTLLCSPSLIAAPGGGHHKITAYDYHDYMNEDIQSKTFIRYKDSIAYNLVWSFDRSIPGEVLRTEIATDADGMAVRKSTSKFTPTTESYGLVQNERFNTDIEPPALADTIHISPPVVILTDSMAPGIAWASAGEMNSTFYGVSYFIDKREVVGVENVSVTAGSFHNCLKVHVLSRIGSNYQADFVMDWICPDIGIVKRVGGRGTVLLDLASVTYNE